MPARPDNTVDADFTEIERNTGRPKKKGLGLKVWASIIGGIIAVVAITAIATNGGIHFSSNTTNGSNENQVKAVETITFTQKQIDEIEAKAKAEAEANAQKIVDEKLADFEAKQAEKEAEERAREAEAAKERELQEAAALAAVEETEVQQLRKELEQLKLSATVSGAVATTPVSTEATGISGYKPLVTLAEWEKKNKTLNEEIFVPTSEDFAAMNPHMSPEEFNVPGYPEGISYLLVAPKGEVFPAGVTGRLWRSNEGAPPIKISEEDQKKGYKFWREGPNGHWMITKK